MAGTRQLSAHAAAAKMIRQELKKAFPTIVFSVRSNSYAGGNSVYIEWDNGPISENVEKIVNKYQYGHFDGMQDLYEYSNSRDDIPQVKYVQVRRNVSDDIKEQIFKNLQRTHSYFDRVASIDECSQELKDHWSVWTARDYIYRITVKLDLTNGYNAA